MVVIAIYGKIGSGKTEVGHFIETYAGATHLQFSKQLKNIVNLLVPELRGMPFTETQWKEKYVESIEKLFKNSVLLKGEYTPRKLYQELGTTVFRDMFDKNIWVNLTLNPIRGKNGFWVISDLRFKNEYDSLKGMDAYFIHIKRNNSVTSTHVSETEHLEFEPHFTINNDGTLADLKINIEDIMLEIYSIETKKACEKLVQCVNKGIIEQEQGDTVKKTNFSRSLLTRIIELTDDINDLMK